MIGMQQAEIYKKFLGKHVDVGTPYIGDSSRMFFYKGKLLEVNDEYILLETKTDIRRIELYDVIRFKALED